MRSKQFFDLLKVNKEDLEVVKSGSLLRVSDADNSLVGLFAFKLAESEVYFIVEEQAGATVAKGRAPFPAQGIIVLTKMQEQLQLRAVGYDQTGGAYRGWIFDAKE